MKTSNKFLLGFYALSTVLFLIFLLATRCNMVVPVEVKGNGVMTTVQKNIKPFQQIIVGNQIHLKLRPDLDNQIIINAEENLQDAILVEQDGEVISFEIVDSLNIKTTQPFLIEVGYETLSQLSLNGGSSIIADSTLHVGFLNIRMSGASKVQLPVQAEQINVGGSGASQANLSGSVDFLDVRYSGASQLNAENLQANKVNLSLSGASQTTVYPIQHLDVSASGASKIRYRGEPEQINKRLSGTSSVENMN